MHDYRGAVPKRGPRASDPDPGVSRSIKVKNGEGYAAAGDFVNVYTQNYPRVHTCIILVGQPKRSMTGKRKSDRNVGNREQWARACDTID